MEINSGDTIVWVEAKAEYARIRGSALTTAEARKKFVGINGGTMTGPLVLSGEPVEDGHAVNKGYVDSLVGSPNPVAMISSIFEKSYRNSVAFVKTGAGTASVKAGTKAFVNGLVVSFSVDTPIAMPAFTAGTDYAIYVADDGSVIADANFTQPTGYAPESVLQIGGFHYAPGGNATGLNTGGIGGAQINEYSFWDLKWRPNCIDPRGMTLVCNKFWSDIYLTGTDHVTNGTSKYAVGLADGMSPPKIPAEFGGNGSALYETYTLWEASEIASAHGKRLPTFGEFAALAFGTKEGVARGTKPLAAVWEANWISKWGVCQSSGNYHVWGGEFGGGAANAAWATNTGGRGNTYSLSNIALFGGMWSYAINAGSRCSSWTTQPSSSGTGQGSRFVCDHLNTI